MQALPHSIHACLDTSIANDLIEHLGDLLPRGPSDIADQSKAVMRYARRVPGLIDRKREHQHRYAEEDAFLNAAKPSVSYHRLCFGKYGKLRSISHDDYIVGGDPNILLPDVRTERQDPLQVVTASGHDKQPLQKAQDVPRAIALSAERTIDEW